MSATAGGGRILRAARRVARENPEVAAEVAASDAPDAHLWRRALEDEPEATG